MKYLFGTNINNTGKSGIVNLESRKLICICNKENSKILLEALEITSDLAKWSADNPCGKIYGMSRKDKMDGELIKLEDRAKEIIKLT